MASVEEISFPDTPRSELERTLEELVEHAQKVLQTQGRLRSLLRANRVVVEQLEIEEVLRRIVEAAVDLVDARYGALGVIGPDGFLERFIHVGMSDQDAALIGHLPHGVGVLGAVINEGASIRLAHLNDDPRSSGFPAHHPPMDAFLGVPVRVRDEVFGNLYLTDPAAGRFTNEDEELVSVLAATAGIAIENARLYEDARERERWASALAEVTSALLSADMDPLEVVIEKAAELVDADLAWIVIPDDDVTARIAVARGTRADDVRGQRFSLEGSLSGAAMSRNEAVSVDELPGAVQYPSQPALGPTLVTPLVADEHTIGALSVSRPIGGRVFSDADRRRAAEFASQASVALQVARGRADQQQLERVEDRSRIARDLHDHVIQRLFAAGLSLQAQAVRADPAAQAVLLEQVAAIDAAVAEIRTIVFALSTRPSSRASLRHQVLDVVSDLSDSLRTPPRLSFTGAVDLLVPPALFEDVVAVVRESLSNVARHAQADVATVEVAVGDDHVIVRVADDGVGYRPGPRASGTRNLADRAQALGGTFEIRPGEEHGTVVTWTVPLEKEPA